MGKYIVPGGPNRPNRGAIPPVPPGPPHAPNLTPPTIAGLTVAGFQEAMRAFFELLPQAQASKRASYPPSSEISNPLRPRREN